MVSVLEFWCEYTLRKRNFKKEICVCAVFFAFMDYFAIIHAVNSATFKLYCSV
jgi:hypothetical protein